MLWIFKYLSNDALSTVENFVIWVNFFGASFAAFWSRKAYKEGLPSMRNVFKLVFSLASLYLFSYLLLLILDLPFLNWSAIMRGVSVVVWPVVWAGPAMISVLQQREDRKQLKILRQQFMERLGDDDV